MKRVHRGCLSVSVAQMRDSEDHLLSHHRTSNVKLRTYPDCEGAVSSPCGNTDYTLYIIHALFCACIILCMHYCSLSVEQCCIVRTVFVRYTVELIKPRVTTPVGN